MPLSVITVPSLASNVLTSVDVSHIENEVGLLNFNRLVDNSGAIDNFVNGFSDAFTDQTGVDTGASTIEYLATPDTYVGPRQYALVDKGNVASEWAGDTSNWTFSAFTGGLGLQSADNLGGNVRSAVYWNSDDGTQKGEIIQVKLNDTSSINGLVGWYEKSAQAHIGTSGNTWGAGLFSSSSGHWPSGNPSSVNAGCLFFSNTSVYAINPAAGTWSSAVSNSASDVWTVVRENDNSITIKKNGTTETTTTNYLTKSLTSDWRVVANASLEGSDLDLEYIKIRAPGSNSDAGTFISTAQTVSAAPGTIRLVVIGKEDFTQTMNTDTVMSVSRNNGTNYTNVTMSDGGNYNSSGVKIWVGSADVSSQPSGTSLRFKLTSTASKRFTIHGYSLLYK